MKVAYICGLHMTSIAHLCFKAAPCVSVSWLAHRHIYTSTDIPVWP